MEGNDFLVNETGVAEACHLGCCWLQEKYLEADPDTGWPVIMLYDEPNSSWKYSKRQKEEGKRLIGKSFSVSC